MINDEYVAIRIQAIFGVTPERRNEILFVCGSCLADRLRIAGVAVEADGAFWKEFTRIFSQDDELILNDADSRHRDYAAMKAAVVDVTFERVLAGLAHKKHREASKSSSQKGRADTSDVWRKRLIAAIGGYLSLRGERSDIDRIKAVACRAARKDDFNRLTVAQLRSLYNAFCRQQEDLKRVAALSAQPQRDMDGKH